MPKKKIQEGQIDRSADFAQIAKETGGDTLDKLDSIKFFIDTGNLAINYSCSGKFITGGVPGGRIIEAFGPEASGKSLIGSNVLFGCQQMDGWPILLDCENASNGEFMQRISHLDLTKVVRYAPSSLERAFRQIHVSTKAIRDHEVKYKKPRKPIVFMFDSLTVPPCERELSENGLPMDYSVAEWKRIVGRREQPGERAKIISAEMRKLQSMVVSQDVTVYLVNQIRDKIGVLYGCFSGRSKVLLADGSWMKIAKIVNQKLPVKVMSINTETGEVSSKDVIDWHKNGKLDKDNKFLKIRFRREFDQGRGVMTVTPNHTIFISDTNDKMKKVAAGALSVGDQIITIRPEWFGYDQWQLVYGSILGDGSVRRCENSRYSANLRFCHGPAQEEYLAYKRTMLGDLAGKVGYSKNGSVRSDSKSIPELSKLADYRKDYLIPKEVADNLDVLGLAIWYMDDGTYGGHHDKWGKGKSTIYAKKWKNREEMLSVFAKFGLECKLNDKGFVFDSDNTYKLHQLIARFCPPCMWYKLHDSCHHLYDFMAELPKMRWKSSIGKIESITDFNHTKFAGDDQKYDLTVEDNHSYIVGGALVHNSPETTPGGNAVKFYASLRFRTQAKKKIEHAKLEKFAGINMQVRNIKNRTYRPFITADDVKLYFDEGVDPLSGLLNPLIESERIIQKGAGNYEVSKNYLPESSDVYKFKASKAENRVLAKVLLDCPKLVDVTSQEEVQEYLDKWGGGMFATESGEFREKSVSFDADGNPLETEFDEEPNGSKTLDDSDDDN